MFIKVKMIDENGELNGRAYAYKSDIDVNVGDDVVAVFGSAEKTLRVVEINAEDNSNGEFEIKSIVGLASDVEVIDLNNETENKTFDIKIIKESLPIISINFEELKSGLIETLEQYKGYVVTKDNLSLCKATQKELAGLRTKIDNYRKDKKKVLSAPITKFEAQCKELIELVECAEQPIKDGIKIFDDSKRDTKKQEAIEIIKEIVAEQGLNEKFAKRLDVLEKYCNLTAKKNEVRTDVEQRAFALKIDQDREQELLEIIQDTIDTENERINKKLQLVDFDRLIKMNASTKEVITDIRKRAKLIYEAENPKPVEKIKEEVKEEVKQEVKEEAKQEVVSTEVKTSVIEHEEDELFYATYRITAELVQLKGVSEYLRTNNITYNVIEQGRL